jgi:hypothetical protein
MTADHAGAPGDQDLGACKRLRGDNLHLLEIKEVLWNISITIIQIFTYCQ